ncbi:DNA cytosine methyltransferase [Paraburkholderia phymatum]|uniref:DNA (cytosine-5-)-methyltransferase n=1 Tax=Paraburkholderia phymatum (strain DSM 17167 / CIP 108236 / LMG 21445 / STM815) TaxID=391038 RepID=B2JD40_PARP8|nr:DNA cytosine methyltransferase [Paraburkholderia phymatum]ACC71096.1 C-5 cytosine-specific DNA methylase [Paraburkholderia phymatum STM815]
MKRDLISLPLDLGSELIIDNFAGGGGASTGLERAFGRPVDVAINHDPEAIAMHTANHPHTAHYCESVFGVDPIAVTRNQPAALVWLSPDCKHFSKAKGSTPVSKKIRGLAWIGLRWAATVKPRVIMLENVEEFQTWGPLAADGRPDPKQKGRTFRSFVNALRAQGYVVDWRELRACDFGAPTIRKRLFLVARRDHLPIVWPTPTHGDPKSAAVRAGKLQPWRTAAECIDWSLPCPSIFERSKPLKDATLRRIAKGIMKFVVNSADPFIVSYYTADDRFRGQPVDAPLGTPTTANRFAVVAPTLMHLTHQGADRNGDLNQPLATVTGAHRGEQALVSATLIQTGYGEREGQSPRVPGLDKPLGTAVAGGVKHAVVSAFLAKHYGGVVGTGVDVPTGTVTTTDHHSVVTSHLLKLRNNQFGQDVREPMPTLTAGGGHVGEVRTLLQKYHGPDALGIVTIRGEQYAIVDIGMRMLTPRELARAQGFPDSYVLDPVFEGKPLSKTAQVRMIGNSVCPDLSTALVVANFAHEKQLAGVAA